MTMRMTIAALLGLLGTAVASAGDFGFSFGFGRSSRDVVVVDRGPVVIYDRPATYVVRDYCEPRVIVDNCGPDYVIYDRPTYYRSYSSPRYSYSVRSYGYSRPVYYRDSCGSRYTARVRYR